MPSGRDFIVERVEDGTRHVLWSTYQPGTHIVLEESDHVHFLIGSAEELEKFAPVVNRVVKVTEPEDIPKKRAPRKTVEKKAAK